MLQDWQIQGRSDRCAQTGRPFADGEYFHTLLQRGEGGAWQRLDLSAEAWKAREADADAPPPFCFWRAKYQPPPPPAPETLGKASAEEMLRRFLAGGDPAHARTCYILALMLERKRLLRPVARDTGDDRLLVYEHAKTGETFLVTDPQLKLDQLEDVQTEVAALLAGAD